MNKVYSILLICLSFSCNKQAQSPKKFLKTINNAISTITTSLKENDLTNISNVDTTQVQQSIETLNTITNDAIKNITGLKEIDGALGLKKETLTYLKNVNQLFDIDFKTRTNSPINLFKKKMKNIKGTQEILGKIIVHHSIYNIFLPEYLKGN